MRKLLTTIILTAAIIMAKAQNPFYQPFEGVHGTPEFSKIDNSHWMPAIDRGIEIARAEIDAITNNPEAPTFENTIVAFDNVGQDLNRVLNVFYPLLDADGDDQMMEISLEAAGKLSDYSTDITLNEDLWKRIKSVYDNRANFNLDKEDQMLLTRTYESFALNGANLEGQDRETFRQLSSELSRLTNLFGQNVVKEMATYKIILTQDDLSGLPEGVVATAREAAQAEGLGENEYLFTLDAPVYGPFMKYSDRRDLRERFYRTYTSRNSKGEFSNLDNIKRITEIRLQIANLLGSDTYARHSLKRTMAESPEGVYDLLNRLRDAYKPPLAEEMRQLNEFASEMEGQPVEIKPWDYSYYANKLRNARYAYDEEELRPYFELNNTIEGVFGLASKLYGLQFTQNDKIEGYHPDVKAFDVTDADGRFIGVIYTDFFPRPSKRQGAWMTDFRGQNITSDGTNNRPFVTIVMNFTKPTADKPSLLTPSEVETFLHEFGHALHGLLADTKYLSLSGTNVYRDFVELPSQFNENYLTEKEFLDGFARHYQTGEPIPQELIDKIVASSQFGAAYSCMRQLGFGFTDMAFHTITEPVDDVLQFEYDAIKDVQIFPPIEGLGSSPTFSHIFSGGYAAGYYSYKWSEVLDADAFAQFKKNGIFDKATADSFRQNVLSRGGTENPAELYRRFRGQDPTIDALLERDGIRKPDSPTSVPQRKDN